MIKTEYEYTPSLSSIQKQVQSKVKLANRLILEDIHRQANKTTPMAATVQLRGQVSKIVDGYSGTITWEVPYAQYQERGKRFDGTHVVKHYTTPGTGAGFAKKAVETVLNGKLSKYYK